MTDQLKACPVPPRWYSQQEIEHCLQRMNYSEAVIAELAPWFFRHIQSAFNKGYTMASNTRAQAEDGEAVACWALAHRNGGGPLFADCIYDNVDDAKHDADALNGDHGDLVPVPLYTHPTRAQEAGEDARDAARYRWLRKNSYEYDNHLSWIGIDLQFVNCQLNLDASVDKAMKDDDAM